MTTPSIIVKNISANQYGNPVLNDISLELQSGQHLAIIGESGSGKSSLAKAIAGKLFTKGSIDIHDAEHSLLRIKTVLLEAVVKFKNLSNVSDFYYQQRYNSCDAEDTLTVEQELANTNALTDETEILLDQRSLFSVR